MKSRKGVVSLLVATWLCSGPAFADPGSGLESGDGIQEEVFSLQTLAVGVMWPQGELVRFADPNLSGQVRVSGGETPVGYWFGFGGMLASDDDVMVEVVGTRGTVFEARQNTQQWALFLHFGPKLASFSDNAFFRPRLNVAPGFYVFVEDVDLVLPADFPWEDEKVVDIDTLTLGRFGWQAILGADFFFSTRWGISVDLRYDQVWHLDQRHGSSAQDVNARFSSIAIGVSTPLDWYEN